MTRLLSVLTPLIFILSSSIAHAGDQAIKVTDPYIFATPPNAAAAGGYLVIDNSGSAPDRLLSAASDVAMIQLHRSVTGDDGVARMEHQMDGIEIPAGEMVMLEPGGLHLMFMGLEAPMTAGDEKTVTLQFENAGEIEIVVPVIKRSDRDHGATGHGGHGSGG